MTESRRSRLNKIGMWSYVIWLYKLNFFGLAFLCWYVLTPRWPASFRVRCILSLGWSWFNGSEEISKNTAQWNRNPRWKADRSLWFCLPQKRRSHSKVHCCCRSSRNWRVPFSTQRAMDFLLLVFHKPTLSCHSNMNFEWRQMRSM